MGVINGTYTATGVSHARWPALANDLTPSTYFTAASTGAAASATLSLSAFSAITVEFLLNWTTFSNNDGLLAEMGTSYGVGQCFMIDPNESRSGKFYFGLHGSSITASADIVRPSAGAWHHYACVFDYTAASPNQITPYLDGVAAAYTRTDPGATETGPFSDQPLNFMSRNQASLFGEGYLANFAIYPRALGALEILEHYRAATSPAYMAGVTPLPPSLGVRQSITYAFGSN